MDQQPEPPLHLESIDRSYSRTYQETHRSAQGHYRRSSDSQPPSTQPNPLSFSRPTSLTEEVQPVLHKVATVEDLHQLKTLRQRWNTPQPKFFNRPSDLWTTEELPLRKQSTAYTVSQHTLLNIPNDIDYALRDENQRLRAENKELRCTLAGVRGQLSELNTLCESLRQQKQRVTQQRDDLKRTLQKAKFRVDEQNKYSEQAAQERNLYQEIAQKLRKRVDILLVENTNMREAMDRLSGNHQEIAEFEEKYQLVREQLAKLQRSMQQDDSDWELHKHMWVQEREYYHEIIRKLEFQVECLKKRQ